MGAADFHPAQLQAYREDWRNPDVIKGTCADYRAAAAVDLAMDQLDADVVIDCPALALWGEQSTLAQVFDIPAVWNPRLARLRYASLPAGHFFVDQRPHEVARILCDFWRDAASDSAVAGTRV